MAEGGAAAAMGNVNANDNWMVHFRDTMRGGKFLNNYRMAELHAKEAPERVWELETYGALFDRTKDGKHLAAQLRRPRVPPPGPRRRPHRSRADPHPPAEDRLAAAGGPGRVRVYDARMKVFAECTITDLILTDGRVAGAFGYHRESGKLVLFEAPAVILATGGVGKSYKVTSNSWEYTGDGHALALRAGATLINMEFLQFHPTGMVWPPSVRGHPGHRVGPGRRWGAEELRGQAVHVRLRARRVPHAVRRDRGGGRPLVHRPGQQQAAAGAAAPRRGGPGHQRRGQGGPGHARPAGCTWTSPRAARPSSSSSACPRCTTSSRNWPMWTSPSSPWRSGRPATT